MTAPISESESARKKQGRAISVVANKLRIGMPKDLIEAVESGNTEALNIGREYLQRAGIEINQLQNETSPIQETVAPTQEKTSETFDPIQSQEEIHKAKAVDKEQERNTKILENAKAVAGDTISEIKSNRARQGGAINLVAQKSNVTLPEGLEIALNEGDARAIEIGQGYLRDAGIKIGYGDEVDSTLRSQNEPQSLRDYALELKQRLDTAHKAEKRESETPPPTSKKTYHFDGTKSEQQEITPAENISETQEISRTPEQETSTAPNEKISEVEETPKKSESKIKSRPAGKSEKILTDSQKPVETHYKVVSADELITSLSGGNQQKVIIGKWMEREPDIFLLDEPTRGIDVGAKYEIYQLIIQMAKEGKTIIVVSSEMPEILGITNRIAVMSNHRLAGIVDTKDTDQEALLRLSDKYL